MDYKPSVLFVCIHNAGRGEGFPCGNRKGAKCPDQSGPKSSSPTNRISSQRVLQLHDAVMID